MRQVSLKAILFSFKHIFGVIENKRTSSKLLILCVVIFNKCKIKLADINRHSIDTGFEATRISTSAIISVIRK